MILPIAWMEKWSIRAGVMKYLPWVMGATYYNLSHLTAPGASCVSNGERTTNCSRATTELFPSVSNVRSKSPLKHFRCFTKTSRGFDVACCRSRAGLKWRTEP